MDDLAKRQWEEWALSRRHLIQAGAFALAGGALASQAGPFGLTAAAATAGGTASRWQGRHDPVTDVFSLDPRFPADNQSIWTMLNVYDQLTRVAPGSQDVEPGLAESWESSEDGLTWTFHLREAKLPDGTPLTASDVVFSLERTFESPVSGYLFAAFDSVTADDDRTVTITLSQPWAPMLADLSHYRRPLRRKRRSRRILTPSSMLRTAAVPSRSWSGQKATASSCRRTRITGMLRSPTWTSSSSASSRMTTPGSSSSKRARSISPPTSPTTRSRPCVRHRASSCLTDPLSRVDYIALNHLREPFGDVNVRKAINYAVNKDQIIQTVLFGNAEPAQSLLPKMLWWNEEAEPYPYDPEMAKQLMAESSVPEGFETDILISAGNSTQQQYATIVQQNLAEIGITASIEQLDELTLYNDYFQKGEYNMLAQYHTTDITDPDSIINYAMNFDGGTAPSGPDTRTPRSPS